MVNKSILDSGLCYCKIIQETADSISDSADWMTPHLQIVTLKPHFNLRLLPGGWFGGCQSAS